MTTQQATHPAANRKTATSRTVRLIDRSSLSVADRGTEWACSFYATWWHQRWGVKDFHRRLMFTRIPKTEFQAEPNAENVADLANRVSKHTWRATEAAAGTGTDG